MSDTFLMEHCPELPSGPDEREPEEDEAEAAERHAAIDRRWALFDATIEQLGSLVERNM